MRIKSYRDENGKDWYFMSDISKELFGYIRNIESFSDESVNGEIKKIKTGKGRAGKYCDLEFLQDILIKIVEVRSELKEVAHSILSNLNGYKKSIKTNASKSEIKTINEVEREFDEEIKYNKYISEAILLIKKEKERNLGVSEKDLIDELKKYEAEILDLRHMLRECEIKDIVAFHNRFRKVEIERKLAKRKLIIWQELDKLNGFDNTQEIHLNWKNYNCRTYDAVLKTGQVIDIDKLEKKPEIEEKDFDNEYDEFVNKLNNVDIKNKYWAKRINFVDRNLNDLKAKINQVSDKYSAFRVIGNGLMCYN